MSPPCSGSCRFAMNIITELERAIRARFAVLLGTPEAELEFNALLQKLVAEATASEEERSIYESARSNQDEGDYDDAPSEEEEGASDAPSEEEEEANDVPSEEEENDDAKVSPRLLMRGQLAKDDVDDADIPPRSKHWRGVELAARWSSFSPVHRRYYSQEIEAIRLVNQAGGPPANWTDQLHHAGRPETEARLHASVFTLLGLVEPDDGATHQIQVEANLSPELLDAWGGLRMMQTGRLLHYPSLTSLWHTLLARDMAPGPRNQLLRLCPLDNKDRDDATATDMRVWSRAYRIYRNSYTYLLGLEPAPPVAAFYWTAMKELPGVDVIRSNEERWVLGKLSDKDALDLFTAEE